MLSRQSLTLSAWSETRPTSGKCCVNCAHLLLICLVLFTPSSKKHVTRLLTVHDSCRLEDLLLAGLSVASTVSLLCPVVPA